MYVSVPYAIQQTRDFVGLLPDPIKSQQSRTHHTVYTCMYMVYSQQNGPIKVSHPPCCNTTSMQSQSGIIEIGPGVVEAHAGSHPGAVDAHLGAVEPRPEFVKLQRDSPTRFFTLTFLHEPHQPRPLIETPGVFTYGFEFMVIFKFEIFFVCCQTVPAIFPWCRQQRR
jgi:hypothetical protein